MNNYLKVRQMMAENGYEHTPAEAKVMVDRFNEVIDKYSNYENYLQLKNLTDEEIIDSLKGKKMTLKEFKKCRDFILKQCE